MAFAKRLTDTGIDLVRGRARELLRGLSGRLLVLTIAFVMVAEVLIFLPSASSFRTGWLADRVEAAQLASLAVEADPDFMVSEELTAELLANAEVIGVGLKRNGQRELILEGPGIDGEVVRVELENMNLFGNFVSTIATFFAREGRTLIISATPRLEGGEMIEVAAPEAPLKRELWAFSQRILLLSLLIAIGTGAGVYVLLAWWIVAPMRVMASAMTRFSEAPDDPSRIISPSEREDEIGQVERELAALQGEVAQALKQRARLAALGEAVAKINHDLRNILTSAQLVSDRLAMNADPKVRAQAERLVRATDRGVRLAEDVLRYGRAEEPAPETRVFALRPVLEDSFADAVAAVDAPTGLDLRVDDAVLVSADAEHAHRIFLNLMRNAAQAMAAESGRAKPGMLTVSVRTEDAACIVCVSDDGPGVPERARQALFKPFTGSTRKGGSGLGLAIARELARAQGGDISLARTGAEGSVFEVSLPHAP